MNLTHPYMKPLVFLTFLMLFTSPMKNPNNPNNIKNVIERVVGFFRLFPVFHVERFRREMAGEHAHTIARTPPSKPSGKAIELRAAVRLSSVRWCLAEPTYTSVEWRSSEVIRGVASRVGSLRGLIDEERSHR